jgi:hypothetical protein
VHGDYNWEQNSTVFTVKLKGGAGSIEVRSENAIAVTQKLALSFNDFFDSTQARFMASLVSEEWLFLHAVPMRSVRSDNRAGLHHVDRTYSLFNQNEV